MLPFSLHCTTCKAPLRVTNAAVVGQILPCPKCGSMVYVEPPAAAGPSSCEMTAASTRNVIAAAPPVAASIAVAAASSIPVQPRVPHAEATPAAPSTIEQAAAEAVHAIESGVAAPAAFVPPAVIPPDDAGNDLASLAADGAGWWVAGMAVAAAVVCALALGWGVWSLNRNHEAAFAQPEIEIAAVDASQPSTDESQSASESAVESTPENESPDAENLAATAAGPTGDASSTTNAAEAQQTEADRETPGATDTAPQRAEPRKPVAGGDLTDEAPSPPTDHVARSEPMANRIVLDPAPALENIPPEPFALDAPPTQGPVDAAEERQAAKLPIGDALPPENPVAQPNDNGPAVELKRIPLRRIDVAAQLAVELESIQLASIPLARFADTVSKLSAAPVTLDVDAIRSQGIALDVLISVSAQRATMENMVHQALKPHGLRAVIIDDQLVIQPLRDAHTLRRARYAMDDLVRTGDPSLAELARFVRPALGIPSDNRVGNGAVLDVATDAMVLTGNELQHARMIELCEKLRVARGRPLRTRFNPAAPDGRFDPRNFELASRTARARGLLARRVTAGVGVPAPLSTVVRHLADQTGATILIDRLALAHEGLADETESVLEAAAEPLGEALEKLVRPIGLVYRAIDERTLEITTPAAAAAGKTIEFYPVRGLVTDDAVDGLTGRLSAAANVPADQIDLFYDLPSETLLVAASGPGQARIEAAIRTLGK